MNCLIHIRQRYTGLAQSDKKLADFLLTQPARALHLSSQQLAAEAGISQSSVVKFAQKLGFKGFPALKLAISEALVSTPTPHSVPVHNQIRGDDPLRVVGEKLIHEKVSAMNATLDVNSEDKLQESVIMLRDARRIVLTGIGASGLVARNFGWKLMKIGFHAVVEQDMHALLATTQAMESSDLLLAISYTGERRRMKPYALEQRSWRSPASPLTPCSSVQPAASIPLPKSRPPAAPPSPLPAPRCCSPTCCLWPWCSRTWSTPRSGSATAKRW